MDAHLRVGILRWRCESTMGAICVGPEEVRKALAQHRRVVVCEGDILSCGGYFLHENSCRGTSAFRRFTSAVFEFGSTRTDCSSTANSTSPHTRHETESSIYCGAESWSVVRLQSRAGCNRDKLPNALAPWDSYSSSGSRSAERAQILAKSR